MHGFKTFRCARILIAGIELMHTIAKRQMSGRIPVSGLGPRSRETKHRQAGVAAPGCSAGRVGMEQRTAPLWCNEPNSHGVPGKLVP